MARRSRIAPLAAQAEPALTSLALPATAEAARTDTERAGYAGHSPELQAGQEERARAGVRSAAALAPDAEKSARDRVARVEVDALAERLADDRAQEPKLKTRYEEAAHAQAGLPAPFGPTLLVFTIAVNIMFSAVAAVTAGELLTTTLDELLRPWANGIAGGNGARFSATVAFLLGTSMAAVLNLGQTFAAIGAGGRLTRGAKALLFMSDIMLAAAFGVLRFARHPGSEAIAFSLAELAILLGHTCGVLGFAKLYELHAKRAEAYRPAKALTRSAGRALERCRADIDETRSALGDEVSALGAREDGARYAQLHADLAASTARAEHLTTAAKLSGEYAKNAPAGALTAAIDAHLAELSKGGDPS